MTTLRLLRGDCISLMRNLPPVDLILCDLPYGTTQCPWDSVIPFNDLWEAYDRLAKGAIVLTCSQPFTSLLVSSNLNWFRHEWVWDKVRPSGMLNAKRQPMMRHESICVFSKHSTNYHPIMEPRASGEPEIALPGFEEMVMEQHISKSAVSGVAVSASDNYLLKDFDGVKRSYTEKYPQSIIRFCKPTKPVHPTQKPVALMSYLIRTYAPVGGTVLDNCMGSGTTGLACLETGNDFVGIEKDPAIFDKALVRIGDALMPSFFQERSAARPTLFD